MELTHYYAWKNNEKRETLYLRPCQIIASGKKNSVMIEFENGQREIVSRHAVKKIKDANQSKQLNLWENKS